MRPSPSRRGCFMRRFAPLVLAGVGFAGCSSEGGGAAPSVDAMAAPPDAGAPARLDGAASDIVIAAGGDDDQPKDPGDPKDQPLVGLSSQALDLFMRGDRIFEKVFAVPE